MDDAAVGELDVSGDGHGDADRVTALAALPGDGCGDAEDDEVEAHPDEIHDDGADMAAVVHAGEDVHGPGYAGAGKLDESRNRAKDAKDVHRDHEEKGAGDAVVEETAVDDSALRGHVEAAEFGVDEGEKGGDEDVRRKNRLVDLVPEGVAMLSLDARVGDVGKHEVRKRVGQDGGPVAGDIDVSKDEIDERRGEKDKTRKRVEEVRHRVEVAEALREARVRGRRAGCRCA